MSRELATMYSFIVSLSMGTTKTLLIITRGQWMVWKVETIYEMRICDAEGFELKLIRFFSLRRNSNATASVFFMLYFRVYQATKE